MTTDKRKTAPDAGTPESGKGNMYTESIARTSANVKPCTETDIRYVTAMEIRPATRQDIIRLSLAAMVLMDAGESEHSRSSDLRLVRQMMEPSLHRLALIETEERETAHVIADLRTQIGFYGAERVLNAYEKFYNIGGMD